MTRWFWPLVWAFCLAANLTDAFTGTLDHTETTAGYLTDAVLGLANLVLLIASLRAVVRDAERQARQATIMAVTRSSVAAAVAREEA